MNINDFKSAYDDVHATKSLKKKVMQSAMRKPDVKPRSWIWRYFLPAVGGVAGTVAAVALVFLGAGYIRDLFIDKSTGPGVSDLPVLTDSIAYIPKTSVTGTLVSPKEKQDPSLYETMPDLSNAGIHDPSEYSDFRCVFKETFVSFGRELIDYVGKDEFDEWSEKLETIQSRVSGQTFYNQKTLLSYLTYFEISEQETLSLLLEQDKRELSYEEIKAVATRNEELCYRLFVNSDKALVTRNEGGYIFYSLQDLYEMRPVELAELLKREGDILAESLLPLQEWADEVIDPVYSAAVRRKNLIVSSYLYQNSCPPLNGNLMYNEYYPQKVCDFSEYINIDGCVIFNYVRRLAEQSAGNEQALESAIYGDEGKSSYSTVPSYHRLLNIENLEIDPARLYEAVALIDRHYYGQTGVRLYTDEEIGTIAYGTDKEFIDTFAYPWVFRSAQNFTGAALWVTAAELYNSSSAGWLKYDDLSTEQLMNVYEVLESAQAEFFHSKIKQFNEIRLITAAYLDGGALEADEKLLSDAPMLPEQLQFRLASDENIMTHSNGGGTLRFYSSELYYAKMTDLAKYGVNGTDLAEAIDKMIAAYGVDGEFKKYLLLKKYLYCWHTDHIDLYCDEYLDLLDCSKNNVIKAYDNTVYIIVSDKKEADNRSGLKNELRKWHLTNYSTIIGSYSIDDGTLVNIAETISTNIEEVIKNGYIPSFTVEMPEKPGLKNNTISEYILNIGVNPVLPEAGDRGLFCCAGFGRDNWLETDHRGMDFAAADGDSIAALDKGTVSFTGEKNDLGLCVITDHADGMQTLYAHCSEIYVSEGQEVDKGSIIAAVGSTGYSYGPHLHFEVLINGEQVDPLPYIEK